MKNEELWTIRPELVGCYEFDLPVTHPRTWMTQPHQTLMLTLSGTGTLYRKEAPFTCPVDPEAGALYYLHGGLVRYVEVLNNRPMHLISFAFNFGFENGLDFFDYYTLPGHLSGPESSAISRIILDINRFKSETGIAAQMERQRLMCAFCGRLAALAERRPEIRPPEHSPRCTPAVDHLNRHFREPPDIGRLAALCAVSRPHFFRLFRAEMRMTTQEFLCRKRLREAEKLLLSTDLPVSEVATRSGWNDPFHFSRLFTRRNGVSPSAFRESFRRYGAAPVISRD